MTICSEATQNYNGAELRDLKLAPKVMAIAMVCRHKIKIQVLASPLALMTVEVLQ